MPPSPWRDRPSLKILAVGGACTASLLVLSPAAAHADTTAPSSSATSTPSACAAAPTPDPSADPSTSATPDPSECGTAAPTDPAISDGASPDPATSGTAASDPATSGTVTSDPPTSGSAAPAPAASDPATTDAATPGPVTPSQGSATTAPAAQNSAAPGSTTSAPAGAGKPASAGDPASVTNVGTGRGLAAPVAGSSSSSDPYSSSSSTDIGAISRNQVIQRAKQWVAEAVPYSQTSWWTDSLGTYRQDCSGYVSMAWHLDEATDFWTGNLGVVSHEIAADDLLPGDILLSDSHTFVFAGWDDSSHTTFDMYEESRPGTTAHFITGASYSHYASTGFKPYRYNQITDVDQNIPVSDAVPAAPGVSSASQASSSPFASGQASVAPVHVTSALLNRNAVPATLPKAPDAVLNGGGGIVTAYPGSTQSVAGANSSGTTAQATVPVRSANAAKTTDGIDRPALIASAGVLVTGCLGLLWRSRRARSTSGSPGTGSDTPQPPAPGAS